MEKEYKYSLQTGPRNKSLCPACNRRSFVRYVDTDGNYLDDAVGKCDHLHSCGYHKSPAEFFRENPEMKDMKNWRTDRPSWLDKNKSNESSISEATPCFFPDDLVRRTQRYDLGYRGNLWHFIDSILDPLVTEGVFCEYGVGFTKTLSPIFWQFDVDGRCRGGKIVHYGPDGHRIKDDDTKKVTWAHSLAKADLPEGWKLSQCLYGENLLKRYPKATVGLVESEKTALICAGLMTNYVWVATGGRSTNINRAKVVLKGRKVVVFPDMDALGEWREKFAQEKNMTISNILLKNTSPDMHDSTLDIADLLIMHQQNC